MRLGLYRRIAALADRREIDAFAAELIDRFGPLPRRGREPAARSSRSSATAAKPASRRSRPGPKGAVITLRDNRFANPAGLVELIQRNAGTLKLRPDQKLVYLRNWDDAKARLTGVARLVQALVKIARAAPPEADAQSPKPTPALAKPKVARRA